MGMKKKYSYGITPFDILALCKRPFQPYFYLELTFESTSFSLIRLALHNVYLWLRRDGGICF